MRYIAYLFFIFLISSNLNSYAQDYDILIKNACVFDGSGKDSVFVDVGIIGNKISFIGQEQNLKAKKVIDAQGKYLAPGFIDTHTHADRWMLDDERKAVLPWLYQGVTTLFAGNDGFGPYKVADRFKQFEDKGIGANVALFVGFGSVRKAVLNNSSKKPNEKQIEQMKLLVKQGMSEGAIGFSTGLLYVPQRYAKTAEVIEVSKAADGAIYDTHMRFEGSGLLKSIQETLEIGQKAHMPLHISHIKSAGMGNWGQSVEAIALINEARNHGINITANQYPFEASMTSMKANLIPGWAQEGGNKEMLKRLDNPDDSEKIRASLLKRTDEANKRVIVAASKVDGFEQITGKSLYQLSKEWEVGIDELVIRLLKMQPSLSAISFSMSEKDIINFMKQPWVMTGSDGGGAHPRTYATFTRILEEYVLEKKLFSMAWGIHRATGLTAKTFGLEKRGLIKEGYFADLILFDPLKLKSNSTYTSPENYSEGMDYVIINGGIAIENGKYTGALLGKTIKRK